MTAKDSSGSMIVNLTASEAIDFMGVAAIATELSGRPIVRTLLTDEAYLSGMVSRGLPESAAAMSLGIFRASRLGQFSLVDLTLARLLGRPPKSLRDILGLAISNAGSRY